MSQGRVHVVGAGLAGLSAAVEIAGSGRAVTLYEGSTQAGGRCRSYLDAQLGCRIDNGNHLMLGCNHAILAYLNAVGARDTLAGPSRPIFPFHDLATDERWTVAMSAGRIPWWLFQPGSRVLGSKAGDYLEALRLLKAPAAASVTDRLDPDTLLFRRLWAPLAIAILNTEPETASAGLLGAVFSEMFGAGGAGCLPLLPREGLSETLVDPALLWLERQGAAIKLGARLRALTHNKGRASILHFAEDDVALEDDDVVVLAVPAPVASSLLPGLSVPDEFRAIVNAHYRVDTSRLDQQFVGLIGGTAEWVFVKPGLLSVTISAADRLVDTPSDELIPLIWRDVARTFGMDGEVPPARIIKEKRATFAATPGQMALRPRTRIDVGNLFLAGDWTDTGLPSTIEGAVRSGVTAAKAVCAMQHT
jgi:squalene-associated FAD-dependent desaturase